MMPWEEVPSCPEDVVVFAGKPRLACPLLPDEHHTLFPPQMVEEMLPPLVVLLLLVIHLRLESVLHLLLPSLLLRLLFPQAIDHGVFNFALWLVFKHALVKHPAAGDQEGKGHCADQQSFPVRHLAV